MLCSKRAKLTDVSTTVLSNVLVGMDRKQEVPSSISVNGVEYL